jgi:hypothetical protein
MVQEYELKELEKFYFKLIDRKLDVEEKLRNAFYLCKPIKDYLLTTEYALKLYTRYWFEEFEDLVLTGEVSIDDWVMKAPKIEITENEIRVELLSLEPLNKIIKNKKELRNPESCVRAYRELDKAIKKLIDTVVSGRELIPKLKLLRERPSPIGIKIPSDSP